MTDYVKSTNFTSKDSLAAGNPLKIVKGTEFDTEFNAIATAVATKADIASPALTGVPTVPTAAYGTSSAQAASTAFVQAALQAVYPIGSIYINSSVATNPATLLGFGTWTAFGAGRVPVGYDASNSNFNAAEKTGGSADAVIVSHTHTYSGVSDINTNLPLYGGDSYSSAAYQSGTLITNVAGGANAFLLTQAATTTSGLDDHTHAYSGTTASTGVSGANANLQPYITVYMWKRTA